MPAFTPLSDAHGFPTLLAGNATTQRRETRHPRQASGFTLVELLVVISIISLLIALLLPMLSASQAVAKMTQCSANQRQLGFAFAQYTNDDKTEAAQPYSNISGNNFRLHLLELYLERGAYPPSGAPTRIFSSAWVCPDNPSTLIADANGGYNPSVASYRANQHLVVTNPTAASGSQIVDVVRLSSIAKPPSKISLVEVMNTASSATASARTVATDAPTFNNGFYHLGKMNSTYTKFVDGRMNVLFLDGHSQAYPYVDNIFKTNAFTTNQFYRYYEPRSGAGGI